MQVKEIPDTDSVCVYELDYGKTKIVGMNVFQPLVVDFRQLPFQAVVAQLAGTEGGFFFFFLLHLICDFLRDSSPLTDNFLPQVWLSATGQMKRLCYSGSTWSIEHWWQRWREF